MHRDYKLIFAEWFSQLSRRLEICFHFLLFFSFVLVFSSQLLAQKQNHPSFQVRKQMNAGTATITSTQSTYPPSYGDASGGSTFYEYMSSFSFTVDKVNHKVTITVKVVITTGQESQYGSGEYVNVWIDWDGSGTFDSDEKVIAQKQFAKAVGFKGTLTFTATVDYPNDEVVDETWTRACLGYGYSPGPTGSWSYGNSITKSIELGVTKLSDLRVWISRSTGGLSKNTVGGSSSEKGKVIYSTQQGGTFLTLDPYHGVKGWGLFSWSPSYTNLSDGTFPYSPGDKWENGSKWNAYKINFSFKAKFAGKRMTYVIEFRKQVNMERDPEKDPLIMPKQEFDIVKGTEDEVLVTGAITNHPIKTLGENIYDYYIRFSRKQPPSMSSTFWNWWVSRQTYVDFRLRIQRRPFYVSEPKEIESSKEDWQEVNDLDRWTLDRGWDGLTSLGSAVLGVAITAGVVALVPIAAPYLGWSVAALGAYVESAGATILIGTAASFFTGLAGSFVPSPWGYKEGDIYRTFHWDMPKYVWNNNTNTYQEAFRLKWHKIDYCRRTNYSTPWYGYWYEGIKPGQGEKRDLTYGSRENPGSTKIWPPSEFKEKPWSPLYGGFDRTDPGFKPYGWPDLTNIYPVVYKAEDGKPLWVAELAGPAYDIRVMAKDPDGLGISKYEWGFRTEPPGTPGNASITQGQGTNKIVFKPNDNNAYLVYVTIYDVTELTATRFVVVGGSGGLQKAGKKSVAYSLAGIHQNGIIQNFTDFGVDNDGDSKFDALAVEFDLNVSDLDTSGTLGTYGIHAVLSDGAGNVIDRTNQVFQGTSGSQTVQISFNGMKINSNGSAGPYQVHGFVLDKYADNGISMIAYDDTPHQTNAYNLNDFENMYITIAGSPSDNGVDKDSNGKFDVLSVSTQVQIDQPGTYILQGQLYDSNDKPITAAIDKLQTNAAGTFTMTLEFDGTLIHQNGVDGPYSVMDFALSDSSNGAAALQIPDYTTSAYSASNFEQPFALFTGVTSDQGLDSNQDGLFDSLEVSLGVNMKESGQYTIFAELRDSDSLLVDQSGKQVSVSAGNQNINVRFSGRKIFDNGKDGSFKISYLAIANENNESVYLQNEIVTNAYTYTQFQKPAVVLSGNYQETTIDTDSDNKIDSLKIDFQIECVTSGNYTFTGTLKDQNGVQIAGAYTSNQTINQGNQTQSLVFGGKDIFIAWKNSPFDLDVRVWDNNGALIVFAENVFTTANYSRDQFEPLDAYISASFTESTPDTNSDNFFDVLQIDVPITVTKSSTYLLKGTLIDSTADFIQEAEVSQQLDAGDHTLSLQFSGVEIFQHSIDGPYVLTDVYLYQIDGNNFTNMDYMDFAHTTQAYLASQFQRGSGWLLNTFTEETFDPDNNGLINTLRIKADIEFAQSGTYRLHGQLYDNNGYYIQLVTKSEYMSPGQGYIALDFDGGRLRGHGDASPYHLKYVNLFDPGNKLVQYVEEAYTTAIYNPEDFETSAADLALFATDVSLFEGKTDDDTVTVKARVYNFGGTEADSVKVMFEDGTALIGSIQMIQKITGAQPVEVVQDWNTAGLSGSHNIKVTVDPTLDISEIDETNNDASVSIDLPIADFPQPPTGINITSGEDYLDISWSPSSGTISGYNLFRRQSADSAYQKVNQFLIEDTQYQDAGLEKDTQYFYVLTAYRTGLPSMEGGYSQEVQATTNVQTAVNNPIDSTIPTSFALRQNYPNPFNPETKIDYNIPKNSGLTHVRLEIYNLTGRRVKTLVNKKQSAGIYSIQWNGTDDRGSQVPSGIYMYRLQTDSFTDMKKMILLK